jgi:hypothetical protein
MSLRISLIFLLVFFIRNTNTYEFFLDMKKTTNICLVDLNFMDCFKNKLINLLKAKNNINNEDTLSFNID